MRAQMVHAYSKMMENEGERLTKEAIASEKVAKAIIKENTLLVKRRQDFEVRNKVRGHPVPSLFDSTRLTSPHSLTLLSLCVC